MASGGKREGAGRPAQKPHLKKHSLTVRISNWVLDALNKKYKGEGKGNLIESALIKTYKLKDDGKQGE